MPAAPTIAILGPGGVGGLLAAALTRAGDDVTVIAREATVEQIAREGIEVESTALGDFTARPAALVHLAEPVGALIVATKAAALEAALARVDADAARPGLVVPLLNGFDHMALLRERFGACVVAGTIRVQADRPSPGRVVQTSGFLSVELASDDAALRPPLDALATALENAGVTTRVRDGGEARILWGKLVRLNALACLTAAHDVPFGAIRDDPALWRELEACVHEGVAVARAEGAEIDPAVVFREFEVIHAGFGTSMQRDIAAGREPELDAIAGAVLRAGARHDVPCPTIAALAGRIAERAGVPVPVVAG